MTRLTHPQMLQLERWDAPTVYDGWAAITRHERARGWFNREETRDSMPDVGPMVGHAVTVVGEPSNLEHPRARQLAGAEYREFMADVPALKIVVAQDLDEMRTAGLEAIARRICVGHACSCPARSSAGKPVSDILAALDEAGRLFTEAASQRLGRKGER